MTAGKITVWEFKDEKGEANPYGNKVSAEAAAAATGAADPSAIGGSTHAAQMADLIAAIREGRDPAIPGEAARRPLELILAIYQSAREGREVTLPLRRGAGARGPAAEAAPGWPSAAKPACAGCLDPPIR